MLYNMYEKLLTWTIDKILFSNVIFPSVTYLCPNEHVLVNAFDGGIDAKNIGTIDTKERYGDVRINEKRS